MEKLYGWKYILSELNMIFSNSIICTLRRKLPEEHIISAALILLKTKARIRRFYKEYAVYLIICNPAIKNQDSLAMLHIARHLVAVTQECTFPMLWHDALKEEFEKIRS